jgi:glutamine synthetase
VAETGQSAFSTDALDDLAGFWTDLRRTLEVLEIGTDTWVHEMGRCQYEINLVHGDALSLADQAFLFKYATRRVAARHGLTAVFMAKPITGQPGSSMHVHQSVVDGQGRNIFSDAGGGEAPAFAHYLGGLQRYLPDLMLLFAPYVNSFRRYTRATQAPTDLSIGHDSRLAGLRIPRSTPAARRVENRLAGADANPYLVIAATLACGLAGIEERIDPLDPTRLALTPLPRELGTACRRMAESPHAGRLLGEDFVRAYVLAKELEHEDFLAEVSAWELRTLAAQA